MHFAGRVSDVDSSPFYGSELELLLRISHTLRIRFSEWLADFDLNEGRYSVLQILAKSTAKGCSQTELAEQLSQSESNVSTLIKRMQKNGLVRRSRSHVDRRRSHLSISELGLSLLGRIGRSRVAWERALFSGIPSTDRTRLFVLLKKLEVSLDAFIRVRSDNIVRFPTSSEDDSSSSRQLRHDPVDDPRSPQFALQQMLIALSAHAGTEPIEREVA